MADSHFGGSFGSADIDQEAHLRQMEEAGDWHRRHDKALRSHANDDGAWIEELLAEEEDALPEIYPVLCYIPGRDLVPLDET